MVFHLLQFYQENLKEDEKLIHMKRNIILFFVFLILASSPSFASNDAGFIIRKDRASLTLRFTLTESFEHRDSQFLSEPGSILMNSINWFYTNFNLLDEKELNITIYVNPHVKNFTIREGNGKYFKYNSEHDLYTSIIYQINKQFKLRTVIPVNPQNIPIYVISSKDYINDISRESELFMGSIPSYMYNYNKKEYYLVFLDILKVNDFLIKYVDRTFNINFMYLNSANINQIFQKIP